MKTERFALLGVGMYSVRDASRMTRVSSTRIRRWLRGYAYQARRGERRLSPAVFSGQLPIVNGHVEVGFLDLQEILVIDGLRNAKISWQMIREVHARASAELKSSHPFATHRFKVAGRDILAEIASDAGSRTLVNFANNQLAFESVLAPYLREVIDYGEQGVAELWWPLGRGRNVIIDPTRRFGQPIIKQGVPTAILAKARSGGQSIQSIAGWYEVDEEAVSDAIEYEHQLAA